MPTLRNISPLGDLEIPLLGPGRVVARGEEFDVSDDVAALLLEQSVNFQPVNTKAAKPAATQEG